MYRGVGRQREVAERAQQKREFQHEISQGISFTQGMPRARLWPVDKKSKQGMRFKDQVSVNPSSLRRLLDFRATTTSCHI